MAFNNKEEIRAQRETGRTDMNHLAIEIPNCTTVEGLTALAITAQEALYLADTEACTENSLIRAIQPLETRFGASALFVALHQTLFNDSYVAENLHAWLKPKRLEVMTVAPSKPRLPRLFKSWTRGYGTRLMDEPETDTYFNRDLLEQEPGRIVAILEFIRDQAQNMTRVASPEDMGLLGFSAALSDAMAKELLAIGDYTPLTPLEYRALLTEPLSILGLTLTEQKSR